MFHQPGIPVGKAHRAVAVEALRDLLAGAVVVGLGAQLTQAVAGPALLGLVPVAVDRDAEHAHGEQGTTVDAARRRRAADDKAMGPDRLAIEHGGEVPFARFLVSFLCRGQAGRLRQHQPQHQPQGAVLHGRAPRRGGQGMKALVRAA
ncbi:hypothetical protein D9M69_510930 [compost metagenome]